MPVSFDRGFVGPVSARDPPNCDFVYEPKRRDGQLFPSKCAKSEFWSLPTALVEAVPGYESFRREIQIVPFGETHHCVDALCGAEDSD